MRRAVGAAALTALTALSLTACSSGSDTEDTLAPVGSVATATAVVTTAAGSAPTGPVGSGAVRMDVRLSGISEQLVFDRATVAAAELDPITLDATCTPLDGGDGFVVSIVDVRRLSAGQQLISATLEVTGATGPVAAGEHPARLELGTAEQETTRFEGLLVLDAGLASGTFDLTTGNGATATGSFACGEDVASLPTTTTIPVVDATADTVVDAAITAVSVVAEVVDTAPAPTVPTVPIATS